LDLPESIKAVVEQFSKLPGVGEKTALRQSLIIGQWNKQQINEFSQSLSALCLLKNCQICGMLTDEPLCTICLSDERIKSPVICVVESITDCLAIEKSGEFTGKFHILGGVLNPLLGVGPSELNLESLMRRVQSEPAEEIILAVNPSVEGDATCSYIKELLPTKLRIERIGFGIPMGGNLEYLDSMTIMKALENRTEI